VKATLPLPTTIQNIGVTNAAAAVPDPRPEIRSEWRVDAIIHAVGVTFGLAACVTLAIVAMPKRDAAVLASLTVYGAGLLAMLGCSALYNIAGHGPRKALWRRLDHAAIFVMIAGTYTPFAAIAIGGAWGTGLLVFVWTAAGTGAVLKLLRPGRLETLSIAAYFLLGWTILVAIDRLIAAVSLPAFVLLAAGGVLYSVGVLFHCWDGLPYNRAIWHGFVLTAAACQYFAVLDVVVT
jgi:hemolysin III